MTEREGLDVMNSAQEVAPVIRSDYPEPLWIQAATLIRGQIDEGVLRPGSRLPHERELCQQLGISRVTLRKALNQLVNAGVLPHPFYSVTGADGSFSISGLQAGTYTIEAWHEKYGTQTASVTVAATGTKTQDFTFTAK